MRNKKNWLLPITLLLVCCCITATGCKSMKGNFSKLAFWKKDTPPVSQLAQRTQDVAPPSRTASVLDGTIEKRNTETGSLGGSGAAGIDRYAQTQSNGAPPAGPSAFGRTKPYAYEPAGSSDSIGPGSLAGTGSPTPGRSASGFTNDTRFGGTLGNRNDSANSKLGSGLPSSQSRAIENTFASNSSASNTNTASASAGGIPSYQPSSSSTQQRPATQYSSRDQVKSGSSFASNNAASSTANPAPGQYPSTKFGTYSPAASQAGLNSDPGQSRFNDVSQVSSTEPVGASSSLNKSGGGSLPTLPAIALNRNGSYAPGSTGSAAAGVYPAGFTPSTSSVASQQADCGDGCSCSGCQSKSTADATSTRGGGSFNFR